MQLILIFTLLSSFVTAQTTYSFDVRDNEQLTSHVLRKLDMNERNNKTLYQIISNENDTICFYEILKGMIKSEVNVYKEMIDTILPYPKSDYYSISVLNSNKVTHYLLFEEWTFNKQKGRMSVRLIALAPAYINNSGALTAFYWLSYRDIKKYLEGYSFNLKGKRAKLQTLPLSDFFEERYFNSSIVRVVPN